MSNEEHPKIVQILQCQRKAYKDEQKLAREHQAIKNLDSKISAVAIDVRALDAYELTTQLAYQASNCINTFDAEMKALRAELVKDQRAIGEITEVKNAFDSARDAKNRYKDVPDWNVSGKAMGWSALGQPPKH